MIRSAGSSRHSEDRANRPPDHCDVWTGPCFSNAEINLTGDSAVMAWNVREGTWKGIRLDGLKVAAAIDAEGTLGTDTEGKVKSVIFVDERAGKEQSKALQALARALAPKYLKDTIRVRTEKIVYRRKGLRADLRVGEKAVLRIETKALTPLDIKCGNEVKAFPALAKTVRADCAKTIANLYHGKTLGLRWSGPEARSSMVGAFELRDPELATSKR